MKFGDRYIENVESHGDSNDLTGRSENDHKRCELSKSAGLLEGSMAAQSANPQLRLDLALAIRARLDAGENRRREPQPSHIIASVVDRRFFIER